MKAAVFVVPGKVKVKESPRLMEKSSYYSCNSCQCLWFRFMVV